MRSEVRNLNRTSTECVVPDNARPVWRILSDLLPEIPVGETKSVRISAEIVGEKGEEKVGSKAVLEKFPRGDGGQLFLDGDIDLRSIFKDWQPGESRKVKSILFDTPDGVPVVEFIETPRERLARAVDEWKTVYEPSSRSQVDGSLVDAIDDYLAATEGEGK